MPKAKAAKRAPAKSAAAITPAPAQDAQEVVALDWPEELNAEKAKYLFDFIASGKTIRKAAPLVQLTGQQVHAWKRKHADFAKAMAEAEAIGVEMMIDEIVEDAWTKASDRDTSAAVKERRSATEAYLAARYPERFKTSLLKPSKEGDGAVVVGVVVVPMRSDEAGHVQKRAPIDSTATQIERLPIDTTPAPAFKVTSNG